MEEARINEELSERFRLFTDTSGSIGKRYARMDEIGTPFCITVDYGTVDPASENFGTVTVRSRDSREQVRIKTVEIGDYLQRALKPEF